MIRGLGKCSMIIFISKVKPAIHIFPKSFFSLDGFQALEEIEKSLKDETPINQSVEVEQQTYTIKGHANVKTGMKVRRGIDWHWGNYDVSVTGIGEVIREYRNGWIRVKWDNGYINSYRMGQDNKYDLDLASSDSHSSSCSSDTNLDSDEFEVDEDEETMDFKYFDTNEMSYFLPVYYAKLFPYKQFYEWISYAKDPTSPNETLLNKFLNGRKIYSQNLIDARLKSEGSSMHFINNEFYFSESDDKFYRYKSIPETEVITKQILKSLPLNIELGQAFKNRIKSSEKADPIIPLEKELIFDMQLFQFRNIRQCCKGDNICLKCWKFVACAVKILEKLLKDKFGFNHIFWVYSGRDKIHCWVCDAKARSLSRLDRTNIANYHRAGKLTANINPFYHQHLQQSANIALDYLNSIVIDQGMLSDADTIRNFVKMIPSASTRLQLPRKLSQSKTSLQKWQTICGVLERNKVNVGGCMFNGLQEICLHLMYPVFQVNINKPPSYLSKTPFSIESKTGLICIPFSSSNVDSFDPTKVPKLSDLQEELNEFDRLNKNINIPDYEKTSLKESVIYFSEFVSSLNNSSE